jgi:hypothetical protein
VNTYATSKSTYSNLTNNSSSKVSSGVIVQKKNNYMMENSSSEVEVKKHQFDLSSSLDHKNYQTTKIFFNKTANKQTFLEQFRKNNNLDTGDIGGSLPITSLNMTKQNRGSPDKQADEIKVKQKLKIVKPAQKTQNINLVNVSRNTSETMS